MLAGSCKKSATDSPAAQNNVESLLQFGENTENNDTLRIKYLDSAYSLLSEYKNDSVTRLFYRRSAVAFFGLNKYNKSLKAGKEVYELGKQAKDTVSMAKGLYFSAISYYQRSSNDTAFSYYMAAEKLYERLNDPSSLGEIILYKAYIYYNIGEYVYCESEAFKALRLLDKNSAFEIYNCYNLIATALDGQDNNEGALKYFNLSLEQIDDLKQAGYDENFVNISKASCYNNLGLVYNKMGQPKKAIEMYNDALAFVGPRTNDKLLYARLIDNLAYARFKAGNKNNLPNLFFKALKIRDSLKNKQGIVSSNFNLGEYYLANKDTARAITYISKSYNVGKEIKSHYDIRNSLKMLADIDKKNSRFYYDRYINVTDSLAGVTRKNRDKFARVAYETERLEDEKEALSRKNSILVGVGTLVLLFVGAIFIIYYLNSRNKKLLLLQEQQKANEEIYQLMFEQQDKIDAARDEEKNRIAMELHDGILNNIYAVRLNLEFSNRKTDDDTILQRKGYIKELQMVESEIRAVSHNLSRNTIFNQNNDFATILGFMVTSQKNTFDTHFEAYVDHDINWDELPGTIKINIYRIIQEALQNINKYSKAVHASVEVSLEPGVLTIIISDDGVGFDMAIAPMGIGLKNLNQRTQAVGGTIIITSAPGQGTVITVKMPV
jgi:signal transduction histidine kinase